MVGTSGGPRQLGNRKWAAKRDTLKETAPALAPSLPRPQPKNFCRRWPSSSSPDSFAPMACSTTWRAIRALCGVPSRLGIFAFVVLERLGNPPLTPMNIGSRPARIAEARIPEPPTGRVIPVTSDDPVREVHQMELNWGANHREKTTGELRTVTNPNGERLPSRE